MNLIKTQNNSQIIEFRSNSCLKNILCTVKTNLYIDIEAFNNLLGGQLTSSLPGVRYINLINDERYAIIIYDSGKIVLTNLFYINDLKSVTKFFYTFFLLLLYLKCAHFKKFGKNNQIRYDSKDGSVIVPYHNRTNCKKSSPESLEISLLIDNCVFSLQINETDFERKINKINKFNQCWLIVVSNFIVSNLTKFVTIFNYYNIQRHLNSGFPADMIKLTLKRNNPSLLSELKSDAAKKRKKNGYLEQLVSLHLFTNGKIIITGGQTKEDIVNLMLILKIIFEFFYEN